MLFELGADTRVLCRSLHLPVDVVGRMPGSVVSAMEIKETRAVFLEHDPTLKVLVLHHHECLDHVTAVGHQEAPERVSAIMAALQTSSRHFEDGLDIVCSDFFPPASLAAVGRVHAHEYVSVVQGLAEQVSNSDSGAPIAFTPRVQSTMRQVPAHQLKSDNAADTTFSKGSMGAALRACGAVCHAVDSVVNNLHRSAFCCVRPPGHHSGVKGLLWNAQVWVHVCTTCRRRNAATLNLNLALF